MADSATLPPERFTAATAKATGKAERTVRAAAARGEALGDDLLDIAGTSLDKGVELDALVSMPEPGGVFNFSVFGKSESQLFTVPSETSTASAISSCVAQPTLNPN